MERPLPRRRSRDRRFDVVIREDGQGRLFGAPPKTPFARRERPGCVRVVERLARVFIGEVDPNNWCTQGELGEGLSESHFRPRPAGGAARASACSSAEQASASSRIRCAGDARPLDAENRAVGVEYLKGRSLYRASPGATRRGRGSGRVEARREVILVRGRVQYPATSSCCPGSARRSACRGLASRCAFLLEGVGRNLQDRYEIGVIHKAARPWTCLGGAQFAVGDPVYRAC